ncbi:putative oxidoreductase,short chain dehydrogenase [Xylariaceae sp. FL0255]|nr:putative oxidoreductase,short chain dehydrogenase [Xylariaceae sp. FL0255]
MFWFPLSTLEVVGLLSVSMLLTKIIRLILVYISPSRLDRFAHLSQYGETPWALVTGASDGIGRAYAHELAAKGFNVVLHGRNSEKLSRVRSELSLTHPQRHFKILVADASTVACGPCLRKGESGERLLDFNKIKRELEGLHLTVLVNNAGGAPVDPVCQSIANSSELHIAENISLNALFPLQLTRALLPMLQQNSPSLIINMSTMIDSGFPLLASYSASKRFLMAITNALQLEMQVDGWGKDIEILGIKVGRVTGARGHKHPVSLFVPDATMMARAVLSRAGRGSKIVAGYWAHAIQQVGCELLDLFPDSVRNKVYIDQMLEEKAAHEEVIPEAKKADTVDYGVSILTKPAVGEVLQIYRRRLSVMKLEI